MTWGQCRQCGAAGAQGGRGELAMSSWCPLRVAPLLPVPAQSDLPPSPRDLTQRAAPRGEEAHLAKAQSRASWPWPELPAARHSDPACGSEPQESCSQLTSLNGGSLCTLLSFYAPENLSLLCSPSPLLLSQTFSVQATLEALLCVQLRVSRTGRAGAAAQWPRRSPTWVQGSSTWPSCAAFPGALAELDGKQLRLEPSSIWEVCIGRWRLNL